MMCLYHRILYYQRLLPRSRPGTCATSTRPSAVASLAFMAGQRTGCLAYNHNNNNND